MKREKIFSETETKGFSVMKNDIKERDNEAKLSGVVGSDDNIFGLNSINVNELLLNSKLQRSNNNQISTPKQHSYTVKSKTHSTTQNRDPSLGSKRKIFENPNESNSSSKPLYDPRKPLETSIRSNVLLNTQHAPLNANLGSIKKTSQINVESLGHEVNNTATRENFENRTMNSKRGFSNTSNFVSNSNANSVIYFFILIN